MKNSILQILKISNLQKFYIFTFFPSQLLVGFGTDKDFGQYWILKNSYGKRWGEYGYMRLARGYGNLCGILEQVFICNV